MMDEVVKRISEKTGLSEEQARSAAETVVGFLKEKLPAPIAGQVDSYLGGSGEAGEANQGGDMLGQAQNALGNLGGMFGGGEKSE